MSISTPQRPSMRSTDPADRMSHEAAQNPSERRAFLGWRWVAVALAFPVAGLIGGAIGGPVDAAGAALVGYDTDLGALAVMGLVSGAALGIAQGLALLRQGKARLAVAWGPAMPVLFALGWCATSVAGISVEDQFTVFGAAGAVVFMLLSGLLLARFTPARAQAA